MVEEFMLLANISVAEKIRQEFPQSACLRRHPIPPLSNFEPLIKVALTRVSRKPFLEQMFFLQVSRTFYLAPIVDVTTECASFLVQVG